MIGRLKRIPFELLVSPKISPGTSRRRRDPDREVVSTMVLGSLLIWASLCRLFSFRKVGGVIEDF
jgi:hypothetical protein